MQKLRWQVVILTALLISLGILFLYSASGIYSDLVFKDSYYFVKKQLFFIFVGLVLSFLTFKLNLDKISTRSRIILILSFLLLVSVLFFGRRSGGAKRWFGILGFGIQPIEFVKIAYILYLADFLNRKRFYYKNFRRICLPLYLVAGSIMVLLLLQPDFGNAIFIAILTGSMLFFSGVPLRFLFYTILGVVPFVFFAFWKLSYLKLRFLSFINPWEHSKTIGFQLVQSLIAVGSGRIFGQGLGLSRQKLFYLPQAQNDFIFSIIAEELGFLGASLLLTLYLFLFWNLLKILNKIEGMFKRLFLMGIILSLLYQVVINLAVCLGLLPTKGLPLPFISYGGSALIANMIMIALVLNLSRNIPGKV